MAEEFHGTRPLVTPIVPDQQKLTDVTENWGLPDLSEMDANYKKMMAEKAKAASGEQDDDDADAPQAGDTPPPAGDTPPPAGDTPPPAGDTQPSTPPPAGDTPPPAGDTPPPAGDTPPPSDIYPDVQLPPNARGKSAEAFATLKQRFSTDLASRDAEVSKLKEELEQLRAKASAPIPPEVEKELKENRLFRARFDLQADPEFTAKYDSKIGELNEFIYDQLRQVGYTDAHIEKIKAHGGLDKVNYEQILEDVKDPHMLRLIQSRMDDVKVLRYEQEKKLKSAKEDIESYIQQKRDQYQKSVTAHTEATQAELETLAGQHLKWLQEEPKLPATADDKAKALHKEELEFIQSVKEQMQSALQDDSPQMRAVMIATFAQSMHIKREFARIKAAYEIAEKARKEAEGKLATLKKASLTRLPSTVQPDGALPKPNLTSPLLSASEAMDALRKQQLETR